jgi:hypothetical protein
MSPIRSTRWALALSGLLLGLMLCGAQAAGASTVTGAATFTFSSGAPDGKMALASRPASSGKTEIEAADDFVLTSQTAITHATFTGLMPTSGSAQRLVLEIYRVFPLDSNATRTITVPTRVNSPSDVDFQSRDTSVHGQLRVSQSVISSSFTAANSVLAGIHPAPNQTTGGEGPVAGQEVLFSVTLTDPFVLPPGHYFFVPQVQVSGPATNFYWLSTPHPTVAPGTPFTPDLQAWIRNSALQPDWLRAGTDIVGGTTPPTFNAAFTLNNAPLPFGFSSQQLTSGIGVKLAVKVPSAGKLVVFDPQVGKGHKRAWFDTATVSTTRGGTVHVKVVPNATGRKQLALKRTLHLRAELKFTPSGGQPSEHTIKIVWRR